MFRLPYIKINSNKYKYAPTISFIRYLMLAAEDGLVNRDDFRFLHTGLEQHYALTKNKSM